MQSDIKNYDYHTEGFKDSMEDWELDKRSGVSMEYWNTILVSIFA